MRIETDRLILRNFEEKDLEDLYAMLSDEEAVQYEPYLPMDREAVACLFGQGVHRIYAECDPENAASRHLLERLGFEREAHLKQNVFFWRDREGNPIWKDTFICGKLNG